MLISKFIRSFMVACIFALGATAQSDVLIETATNGQDADVPPGAIVTVGNPVTWTYRVTNSGSRDLINITVTDDQGVTVTCPATTLSAGLSMTCTANGIATAGQYANIGTAEGELPDSTVVSDTDPSHYFGQAAPAIVIEKSTNGVDADIAPGPIVPAGSSIDWTYEVTNIGTNTLSDVIVSDDQGVVVTCPGTTLNAGESMTCTGSGTAQIGQYANLGSATAQLPDTSMTADTDPSHYYGQTLAITKYTNGVEYGAAPGALVQPGETVTWTYEVTNPGPATVTNFTVTDDQGVSVTCPATGLSAGESITCTGTGTAVVGQYTNVGTATAELPAGGIVSASDTSYYFGNTLSIEKSTNGVDADTAPGPAVLAGSTVNWTYAVTNNGVDPMTNVAVTDDQGVLVTCPATTLAAAEMMTCTATDIAIIGPYANIGTAEAEIPGGTVQASDPSHYVGGADFGDVPDPAYPTLLASDGARHLLGAGLYLGQCVDAEADGQVSAGADGDDLSAGTTLGTCASPGDDEDGVTFTAPVLIGLDAAVAVVASAPCTLSAWIDFNADGDWSDAGEDLFPGGTGLSAGTNNLTFAVPPAAVAGATAARFRCTTDGAVGVTGQASDGEVEDHVVLLETPVPDLAATKSGVLVDVDGDGVAEPGDTLRYTITIVNSGTGDATNVVLTDAPDANTNLVVGGVTTTAGTVVTGNTIGDTSVEVAVGTVASFGGTVTITYDVVIDDPLPSGMTPISNQGSVVGDGIPSFLTDDPAVGGASDPTILAVFAEPLISATKTAVLATDADGDGEADPADVIRYTIVVQNSGSSDAEAVVLSDTPDVNTDIVDGSVTTTQGVITSGNAAGDTTVTVEIGTLAGSGGAATVEFDVRVPSRLPGNVTSIVNSATITGSNFAAAVTDDPSQPGVGDVTSFPVSHAIAAIPTLDQWALIAMIGLLSIVGLRRLGT